MLEKIRKSIANLVAPQRNSMSLPQQFLKYGPGYMESDWTQVVMTDRDIYTGYGYAAIRNRANAVASTAVAEVRTDSPKKDFQHPYLEIISKSKSFSNYAFWNSISVFLDLEGVYYLMAIRAEDNGRVGKIKEFKLLNPFNIRRVLEPDQLEVQGYIETRKGFVRTIPKSMIIEMRDLNPFDDDKPMSMTDAAKEAQFTLKTSGDYTRNALRHNVQAPGILSTDQVMDEEVFRNFVSNIQKHKKGEPIFGNGGGAITYQSMQNELAKAALKDINEINRDALFAVAGVSKTSMGIEQSGTTRETSKVQKDLMMEGHILPRIQLILDALNQDYKNNYPKEEESTKAVLVVQNPSATDHDADLKYTEVKTKQFELYTSLVNKGYDTDLAAQYVEGKIDIETLGEPTNDPITTVIKAKDEKIKESEEKIKELTKNDVTQSQGIITQQQGYLQNAVVNIEEQAAAIAIDRIRSVVIAKNSIEDYSDLLESENKLITKREKREMANELEAVLVGFYGIIITLEGGRVMRDRMGEFAMKGDFELDKEIRNYIKLTSKKVATSHLDTVASELYETARKAALEGKSQDQIMSILKTQYAGIAEERSKLVARTETNRAFTRAQFDADRQFVEQNDLVDRAYKKWRTRSDNPCAFCESMAAEDPIPLDTNFRDLGGSIKADGKTLKVDFESLEAGNAHPNCSCDYELIIRKEKK